MNILQTLIRAPEFVIGYHGCHAHIADQILQGDAFQPSTNSYDWLGTGVYFWEYAPFRAQEWAHQRFGNDGVVLQATLHLHNCLNLLDVVHFTDLQAAYAKVVHSFSEQEISLPVNRNGQHRLDRLVVDRFCNELVALNQMPFDTVRGSFPEGVPVYNGSQLLSHTHTQIAVRTLDCISSFKLVQF